MKYDAITPQSRTDAERALRSRDRDEVIRALIGVAMSSTDWRWVQKKCVELSTHPDVWVRRACATALLHVARTRRRLDMNDAMVVFDRLRADPQTADEVPHTLEEIDIFLHGREST